MRDFAILTGGHFGILATGVEGLTIDNLRIDTNRDGIDIDPCCNVRISNVSANSPNDDAIVLHHVNAQRAPGAPSMWLKGLRTSVGQHSSVAPDGRLEKVNEKVIE